MTAVSASIAALEADNLSMLQLAVEQYHRVMTYLLVWHGRACWKADYEGANVAYPQQTAMGHMLGTLSTAQVFHVNGQLTEANMEDLRATFVQSLQVHARMLNDTHQEMLDECTP